MRATDRGATASMLTIIGGAWGKGEPTVIATLPTGGGLWIGVTTPRNRAIMIADHPVCRRPNHIAAIDKLETL